MSRFVRRFRARNQEDADEVDRRGSTDNCRRSSAGAGRGVRDLANKNRVTVVYSGMKAARALMPPEVDEHQILLAALFDAHADRLYRLARRLTASTDDARDRVQETFLRAAQSLRSVPFGRRAEEAWLVRVLVNIQRDEWRKDAVRVRASRVDETSAPNIDSALDAKRIVWRTDGAHPTKKSRDCAARPGWPAHLRDRALLGITTVTVRWHLSRGRRELRQLLKGDA